MTHIYAVSCPSTKNSTPRLMKFTIFVNPYLCIILLNIISLSGACLRVERNGEIMHSHYVTFMFMS